MLIGVLAAAVVASALAMAALGAMQRPTPASFLVVFELLAAGAGVVAVLAARGRFAAGRAVTLLCVAGCLGAGAVLAFVASGRQVMGMGLEPWLAARLAAAGVFAALAMADVLGRAPRETLPRLARGVALAAPIPVLAGLWMLTPLRAWVGGMHGLAQTFLAIFAAVAGVGLLSAAAHCLIRAFQLGYERAAQSEDAARTRPAATPAPAGVGPGGSAASAIKA